MFIAYAFIFSPPGAYALCSPYWLTAGRYAYMRMNAFDKWKDKNAICSPEQSNVDLRQLCDSKVERRQA
jgi:hypothetical protein